MFSKLSSREKVLGICVLGLFVVGGLFVAFTSFMSTYSARRSELISLQDQVSSMENDKIRFKRADQRKKVYQAMSLNPTVAEARSEYGTWLQKLAQSTFKRKVNLSSSSPLPVTIKDKEVYSECSYDITPEGNLAQLTEFLHKFYSTSYLHRIDNLTIGKVDVGRNPQMASRKNKDALKFTIKVKALSLPDGIKGHPVDEDPRYRLAHGEYKTYFNKILGRNVFGLPNNAPRIARTDVEDYYYTKEDFSISVTGSDEDGDKLEFEIVDTNIEGVTVKQSTSTRASIKVPSIDKPINDLFVVLKVKDTSPFPKSSEKKITFDVEDEVIDDPPKDKPKPKPKYYDPAKFTKFTGIFRDKSGSPLVWLDERFKRVKTHKLREGDIFEVGMWTGKIEMIADGRAYVTLSGGPEPDPESPSELFYFKVGDVLTSGQKVD